MQNVLAVTSVLLDVNKTVLADAEDKTLSSTSILKNLDTLAERLGAQATITNKPSSFNTKNVALSVHKVAKADIIISAHNIFDLNISNEIAKKTALNTKRPSLASIVIPKESFVGDTEVIYSYSFRENSLFLKTNNNKLGINESKSIQSIVLSATIMGRIVANLKKSLKLAFKKVYHAEANGINTCEFWNFDKGNLANWIIINSFYSA